jgi:midasin
MAALTLKSLNNKEPVLLIGPAGVGKTTLANLLGQLMGVISRTLVAHQYLEISDFVGALRPVRSNQEGIFEWQDGPLLQCVRDGGVFLIDEINMCPESVLEGLNSVLEIPASLTVND